MIQARVLFGALLVASLLAACSGGDDDDDGATPSPSPSPSPSPAIRNAALPNAPSAASFMYQGVQRSFRDAAGAPCTTRITVSLGDQVVCYAAADDALRCAGRVYTTTFGTSFVPSGQSGVEQILLSSTVNSATGNAMCTLSSGIVRCIGDRNNSGQFGNGTTTPAATLSQWGTATNIAAIGTGTFDQLCGIDTGGVIRCAGFNFGSSPATQLGGGAFQKFWVDTFGALRPNDPDVFRAENGRAECVVTTAGLSCGGTPFGPAGEVVDGFSGGQGTCWLTQAGTVSCDLGGTVTAHFTSGAVLALAGNAYSDSMCAVLENGSLWCVGSNAQGMLGTGDTNPLLTETMVQPAGSIGTSCE